MFCRATIAGSSAWALQPQWIQVRNMATLKDITRRLKSIKNIQKITKSMKMVAAAKYARAERELKPARIYGVGSLALYEKADIKAAEDMKKHLIIGVSSDRGLCGAIHSSVAKLIKNEVATLTAAGKEVMIVGVGDKIRGILNRTHSDHFLVTFKEVGRKPPTFGDASVIALELLNSGYEFDEGSIIFNRFRSVISYKTEEKPIFSLNTIASAGIRYRKKSPSSWQQQRTTKEEYCIFLTFREVHLPHKISVYFDLFLFAVTTFILIILNFVVLI